MLPLRHSLFALLVGAACLTWVAPATADSSPVALDDALQAVLDGALAVHGGHGASVAVLLPGAAPVVVSSGVSHGVTPLTPHHLLSAGSVTKNLVAALVLRLVEEGLLELDAPIGDWLPRFPNVEPSITVRQLLNHTGGVFNFSEHPAAWSAAFADPGRTWTPEEVLRRFVLAPNFAPGADWHYSNSHYLLLGMVIERVTGSPVSTALRDRLLNPLALTRTFLDGAEASRGEIAHGWWDANEDGRPEDLSATPRTALYSMAWTTGALVSTPEDLARWTQALFGGEVLAPSSLEQMLDFHSPTPGEEMLAGYGLGVELFAPQLTAGETLMGHGGWIFGYLTAMGYLPDHQASLAVMLNENNDALMGAVFGGVIKSVVAASRNELP